MFTIFFSKHFSKLWAKFIITICNMSQDMIWILLKVKYFSSQQFVTWWSRTSHTDAVILKWYAALPFWNNTLLNFKIIQSVDFYLPLAEKFKPLKMAVTLVTANINFENFVLFKRNNIRARKESLKSIHTKQKRSQWGC